MKCLNVPLALALAVTLTGSAQAADYKAMLSAGEATTKQNFMGTPFVRPKNWKTPYTTPGNWPIFENRGPLDRSPKDKPSKVLVLGSGDPTPNPHRFGPALAVIVNGYPYFIDCGEGWWRALAKSALSQTAIDLPTIFALKNLKYMFLTHLHEDHTVGLPSFISNPYKFGPGADKKIYGPKGVDLMIRHINAAYSIDRNEMFQGSITQHADGSTAVGIPVWPLTDIKGKRIFEDKNVKVEAFPSGHGFLAHTYAYRFTTKPDGRVLAFGGDGHYSKGLAAAAKGADLLFIEGITRAHIEFSTWGGKTVDEKVKTIGAYHMFPKDMVRVQKESGVKGIVMVHTQNYNTPKAFKRVGVRDEMRKAGVKNVLAAQDGDLY